MENNLKFIETLTIENFKKSSNTERLEVLQNPHTSKLFFTYNGGTGAVASKGVPSKSPRVSLVEGSEGEKFYLLHEAGEGGAPVVATF